MTMEKTVFIFFVGLLAHIRSARTSLETVWLKDVTTRFRTEKRTLSNLDLPNGLTFHLRRATDELTLNLKRNYDINPNADVYFLRKLKDGQSVLVKTRNLEKEDVAYYQDKENGAFMTVRCVRTSNEQCDRVINGHIRIGDSIYDLRPAENAVTSKSLLEVPGRLGKRYVLQDQAHIQRGNSGEKKDAPYVDAKKGEQELRALHRRFQGQLKQKQSHPSYATLSSRNVAALHNRGATDKYRQEKQAYYVKVNVLIDSGIWNLYSSMVHPLNPLARRGLVKRKITEAYSHIMNGVNLRYKEIKDPSISIRIFLSEFVFIERETDFPHKSSNVMIYNATKYIDTNNYHDDLAAWDLKSNGNNALVSDVAMLFTGYKLYIDSLDNTEVQGLSYVKGVCELAYRTSVIASVDYIWTVWAAAHELGHSLGAYHDGDNKTTACKAEDLFIMTPNMPHIYPGWTYSRNIVLFSKCSVEAFKETLKDKLTLIWMTDLGSSRLGGTHFYAPTLGEPIAVKPLQIKKFKCLEPFPRPSPTPGEVVIAATGVAWVGVDVVRQCVTTKGIYYNKQEYKGYVTKQPGEVYTSDVQCHAIKGPKSVLCETVPADICLLMRCTDPKTGICIEEYFGAARGTACGHNMWCIEGRCVSKLLNDFNSL